MRMHTLTETTKLVTEECCNCGVLFAMPLSMQKQRLEDHDWFYCPSGHGQHYTGKTEAQKQRERADRAEQDAARVRAREDQARAEARHQEARANGYKGAATKAKKRAARGICPAPGCKRSFVDVAKHVATCHPDLDSAEVTPEAVVDG